MFVDTHAHIHTNPFKEDLDDVIKRAQEAGVEAVIDLGVDVETSQLAIENTRQYDMVFAAAGVHPHEASHWNPSIRDALFDLLKQQKVVAVGEIGLDYHYHFSTPEEQEPAFCDQLAMAREMDLPVVVHSRKAIEDTLAQIDSVSTDSWQGVFHCYGDTEIEIPAILKRGFHVSFTGVVTFKNFKRYEAVLAVPLDRLLLETDAPFMSPTPLRGKRNEPAFLVHTAQWLAELYGISLETLANQTTQNARNLFGLERAFR